MLPRFGGDRQTGEGCTCQCWEGCLPGWLFDRTRRNRGRAAAPTAGNSSAIAREEAKSAAEAAASNGLPPPIELPTLLGSLRAGRAARWAAAAHGAAKKAAGEEGRGADTSASEARSPLDDLGSPELPSSPPPTPSTPGLVGPLERHRQDRRRSFDSELQDRAGALQALARAAGDPPEDDDGGDRIETPICGGVLAAQLAGASDGALEACGAAASWVLRTSHARGDEARALAAQAWPHVVAAAAEVQSLAEQSWPHVVAAAGDARHCAVKVAAESGVLLAKSWACVVGTCLATDALSERQEVEARAGVENTGGDASAAASAAPEVTIPPRPPSVPFPLAAASSRGAASNGGSRPLPPLPAGWPWHPQAQVAPSYVTASSASSSPGVHVSARVVALSAQSTTGRLMQAANPMPAHVIRSAFVRENTGGSSIAGSGGPPSAQTLSPGHFVRVGLSSAGSSAGSGGAAGVSTHTVRPAHRRLVTALPLNFVSPCISRQNSAGSSARSGRAARVVTLSSRTAPGQFVLAAPAHFVRSAPARGDSSAGSSTRSVGAAANSV